MLRAALDLLQRPAGPVLEDFPDDAPATDFPVGPLVCPVSFAAAAPQGDDLDTLLAALRAEVEGLRNWYDLAVQHRGRTTAATTGMSPEAVAAFLGAFAQGKEPTGVVEGASIATTLKMASEDLKAYYTEAVAAQPGHPTDAISLANWFWGETAAARVFNAIRQRCLASDDKELQLVGTLLLIPRNQLHRFAG